jgi:starvation-inducible outer membrane lipoprotein
MEAGEIRKSSMFLMCKILVVSFLFLLSGCVAAPLVLTGVSIGSVAVSETTGKSITDHTVSAVNNGKDCRVGRILKDQAVCQDEYVAKLKVTNTGVKPSSIEEIESKYK